jgi:hypothetical protein
VSAAGERGWRHERQRSDDKRGRWRHERQRRRRGRPRPRNAGWGAYRFALRVTAVSLGGVARAVLTAAADRLRPGQPQARAEARVSSGSKPPLRADEFVPVSDPGFGDRWNTYAWSMQWWNGKLYVGVRDPIRGYAVLKTDAKGDPPYSFTPVVSQGGGDAGCARTTCSRCTSSKTRCSSAPSSRPS